MKAILTNRQLWDIVGLTDDPPKATEKNDMALGLIEYSCFWFRAGLNETLGFEMFFTSAKIAWDALGIHVFYALGLIEYSCFLLRAAICALPKRKLHIGISRSLSKMHVLKHF